MSLSLVMALGMLLPTTMNAQNDGFFHANEGDYDGNRANETWTIENNGIGEAPLGSGLLILGAAGLGYAIARRKRSAKSNKFYKKNVTLLLVLTVMLGFTQCKKKVDSLDTAVTNGVYITLDVEGGDKVIVDPTNGGSNNYASVTWEENDVIYVGHNGDYCGFLKYDGSKFGGTITASGNDVDYLHFYFMGNRGEESKPTSVNITDQTDKYPVISYGRSTGLYNSGTTVYSARLNNYCGIMKFVTDDISGDITITGMKNTVTVDFAANNGATTGAPYSFSKIDDGKITLHAVTNTERWAILLPQDEVTTAQASAVGYATQNAFTVPEVTANMYNTVNLNITMTKIPYIDAVFTVGSTTPGSGKSVKFSRGNLQYLGTGDSGTETPKFRFADNQYDIMGHGGHYHYVLIEGYSNYNTISDAVVGQETDDDKKAARDLFGWGSSGGRGGVAPITYPYSTMISSPEGYEWTNYYGGGNSISGTNYDWGVYLRTSIENHGNKKWRTLEGTEWDNLFHRTKTIGGDSKILYGYATVMGIKGIVLLPDNWDGSVDVNFTYAGIDCNANIYTANSPVTWSTMEAAGAVFLPAAGYRDKLISEINHTGWYWSSSINENSSPSYVNFVYGYACNVVFYTENYGLNSNSCSPRSQGYSVRLVFDN